MKRALLAAGTLAALVYAATVVIGAAATPDYSHLHHAISELFDSGAPHRSNVGLAFDLYNLLLGLFGVGVWLAFPRNRTLGVAGRMLITTAALGAAISLFFPMDARDSAATTAGNIHLILAGFSSLTSILTLVFAGLGLRREPGLEGLGRWSYYAAAFVFLTGAVAGLSAASHWSLMGLLERFTIGGFIAWTLGASLVLIRHESASAPAISGHLTWKAT